MLKCFEDMIRVFYANLRITDHGVLYSEVNRNWIVVTPPDWMHLAHLKYEGLQLMLQTLLMT